MRAVREMRLMEFVPRWGIVRTLKQQSVAEHSYQTALLADWIADRHITHPYQSGYEGQFRYKVLQCALYHDLEEVFTGDIPGPAKHAMLDESKSYHFVEDEYQRRFKERSDLYLNGTEKHDAVVIKSIVSCASSLEEVCFLAQELQMGNKSVKKVFESAYALMLTKMEKLLPQCPQLPTEAQNLIRSIEVDQDVSL